MPSTVIHTMDYSAATRTLRIVFVSGLVYDYKDVPPEEYAALRSAFAKGIYFNTHIKNNYTCEKVDSAKGRDPNLFE